MDYLSVWRGQNIHLDGARLVESAVEVSYEGAFWPGAASGRISSKHASAIDAELTVIKQHNPLDANFLLPYLCVALELSWVICEALVHSMLYDRKPILTAIKSEWYYYRLTTAICVRRWRYWILATADWRVVLNSQDYSEKMYHLTCPGAALVFDGCKVQLCPYTGDVDAEYARPKDEFIKENLSYSQMHRLIDFVWKTLPSEDTVISWMTNENENTQAAEREAARVAEQVQRTTASQVEAQTWASSYDAEHTTDPEVVAQLREDLDADLDFYCDSAEEEDE